MAEKCSRQINHLVNNTDTLIIAKSTNPQFQRFQLLHQKGYITKYLPNKLPDTKIFNSLL